MGRQGGNQTANPPTRGQPHYLCTTAAPDPVGIHNVLIPPKYRAFPKAVLFTVHVKIEVIVNSIPLESVLSDDFDLDSITPNLFVCCLPLSLGLTGLWA